MPGPKSTLTGVFPPFFKEDAAPEIVCLEYFSD